jgi:hypothetical protein
MADYSQEEQAIDDLHAKIHPTETDASGITTQHNSSRGGILGLEHIDYQTYKADPNAWNSDFANKYTGQIGEQEDELKNRQIKQMNGAAPVSAALAQSTDATGATIDQAPQGQVRQRQMSLADSLEQSANGTGGPSAADSQFKLASDANMRGAMSMAAGAPAHGGSYSSALKAAMGQNALTTQNAALQSGQLRAQEQMAARGQLGGVLDASRGADVGMATNQAQLGQQNSQFNAGQTTDISKTNAAATNTANALNASLSQDTQKTNLQASEDQQKQIDDMTNKYITAGYSMEQAKQQAAIDYQKFTVNSNAQQEATLQDRSAAGSQALGQAIGGAAQAVGTGFATAMSDRRAKKNITDGEDESEKLLRALKPHGFEYKDERFGEGHRLGVMAQDVERAAPELVSEGPDGLKRIDVAKALSASLAALGTIDKRLSKLEGGKRARSK